MSGLKPDTEFRRALSALPQDLLGYPVGLAVSGGSDSLALMELAARWAGEGSGRLVVFTVDHGLRAEAAREAAAVAEAVAQLGLAHRTLKLGGLAPRQASLRRARHAVLGQALKAEGGRLLLTGHTADDQAETFLMRARQGSGWYGLAGMRGLSLSPVWPEGAGVFVARPLLGLRRQGLRDMLSAQGLAWADDPSNMNAAYERVRMRRLLASEPGLFGRVAGCQERFGLLRAIEDRALARWMAGHVQAGEAGLEAAGFETLTPERAARALGLLLQMAAGREAPQRAEALARLAARLAEPAAFRGATLGGARLIPRGKGVQIVPENASTSAGTPAEQGWRLAATRQILSANVSEIDASAGKESFLATSVPMF